MKKILIFGYAVLLLGIVFKPLHIPGASLLLLLGANVVTLLNVVIGLQQLKTDKLKSLFHFTVGLLTLYVGFRFQFWPMGPSIFGFKLMFLIPLGLGIAYFIRYYKLNKALPRAQKMLAAYLIFVVFISFAPTYKIHYFLNLNPLLSGKSLENDYYAWDKYCWFLYLAGEQDEALEANKKAKQAIEICPYQISQINKQEYKIMLSEREQKIKDKTWQYWDGK